MEEDMKAIKLLAVLAALMLVLAACTEAGTNDHRRRW
jgi:outer membrane lipoprotein-sorting protein